MEFAALRDGLDKVLEIQKEEVEFRNEVLERLGSLAEVAGRLLDDVDGLSSKLHQLRESDEYAQDMAARSPLVTVRIASYQRTESLMNVAIPSILGQSYDRLEVVIVNDGPNEMTRRAVESLRDTRVRYYETPERGDYPLDARKRWMVAGTAPINAATDLARGTWVAHLDDDDEFSADHIEKLLNVVWKTDAELSYGALVQRNLVTGEEKRIWSERPSINQFSFQGALYLTALKFFRYESSAWALGEPGDWNLIRRMKAAGVRIASTPEVVGQLHMTPYTHKS